MGVEAIMGEIAAPGRDVNLRRNDLNREPESRGGYCDGLYKRCKV
jgi:hypothetical protein